MTTSTTRARRSLPRPTRFRYGLLTLSAAAVFSGWIAAAQTLPQGVQKGGSLAGITQYTYSNGLRVLLLPDSGSSTITINVTYLVGSRHEGYGETGMAHLLEHMNFIASTHGRNIKKELQDHGARWNGTTYYDRTNYFETVNASEDNLQWALDLEAERMVNMRIEKALLDTEMTVVRNEFERGENSVAGVLEERVLSTAYLWHNYGKSTIGSRADIERVPIDRLAAFYHKYYQPDNAVVTIAGQIDSAATLAAVARTLGAIPRPARTLDEPYTTEPPQDGERTVELRRVGRGKNLIIAYHAPAMAHPDAAALEVTAGILARRGGTGRLDKALVDSKKALSVAVSMEELHDPGVVLVSATLSNDQSLDEVKKVIIDTIAGLAHEAPTMEEIDRARTRIIQGMDRSMANSQQLAMQLNEVIAAGDWRLLFTNYEEIKRVTPDDVTRVVRQYFKDSNRTVGMFIPEPAPDRTTVPDAPGIETLLKSYTPEIHLDAGEALDPSPGSLEKRIQRTTLGGLPGPGARAGGFRLALLPKGTRGSRAQASLTLRFGDERSLAGRNAAAQMADALLMRGTKNRSRQQIQDEMQKLNATITVGGGGGRGGSADAALGSVTASISTTSDNLVPALRLAVEILREPAFAAADFEQIRQQQIAQIERGRTEPGILVAQALQAHLSPFPRSDVRHVRTIDEEIEDLTNLTLDDVRKFHEQFYGASQGDLIVVGKFDQTAVKNAAADLLASWKSPSPYARIVNTYQDAGPINTKIETPDKENAQFSAGLRLRMRDSDPDYPAMVMANYMFGGGGLSSRLPDRVRNREGLSYGVSSSFAAPVEGDAAVFSASAIANPANIPKVEASFMDELTSTLRDGFTASELAAAKKAIQDSRVGARSSDAGLLNLISSRELYGRTLAWDEQLDGKLAALSLEQINAAFRRHINTAAVSIVKGGDFKAAKAYQ
ncbi:MAG TPA: pitrilysin family protein [Vicinamibacterales bacterium]|nr:pitrilysin family protein [Vicinamibacterales bacterium]